MTLASSAQNSPKSSWPEPSSSISFMSSSAFWMEWSISRARIMWKSSSVSISPDESASYLVGRHQIAPDGLSTLVERLPC